MSKSTAISIICAILLVALLRRVNGQGGCINLTQVGESVIFEKTTIVCNVISPSDSHVYLDWDDPYGTVVLIDFHGDQADVWFRYPDKHDCQWDYDQQQAVLTIKHTNISDDGRWRCIYRGVCSDVTTTEVDVTGMAVFLLDL